MKDGDNAEERQEKVDNIENNKMKDEVGDDDGELNQENSSQI